MTTHSRYNHSGMGCVESLRLMCVYACTLVEPVTHRRDTALCCSGNYMHDAFKRVIAHHYESIVDLPRILDHVWRDEYLIFIVLL